MVARCGVLGGSGKQQTPAGLRLWRYSDPYLRIPHLLVGERLGEVSVELERLGEREPIAVRVPSMVADYLRSLLPLDTETIFASVKKTHRVLVQSLAESALAYFAVYQVLLWLDTPTAVAGALALVAMAASPTVLTRVVADTRAAGPVTERAIVLTTLSTLYVLTLGSARAELMNRPAQSLLETISPVMVVLGISILSAALLALLMRWALRFMSPASENTTIVLLALIAAASAMASHLGGSAPLAALLAGILLKQLNPRPWAWPRQLGNASSLLTMLMFVLVSTVAAQADWSGPVAGAGRGAGWGAGGTGARWVAARDRLTRKSSSKKSAAGAGRGAGAGIGGLGAAAATAAAWA